MKGEELTIVANHDEYSLWFDVTPASSDVTMSHDDGLALPMSRLRLGEVNSAERNSVYAAVLRRLLLTNEKPADGLRTNEEPEKWVLALGDQSLLSLFAAKLFSGKVIACTANKHMQEVLRHLAVDNSVIDRLEVCGDLDRLCEEKVSVANWPNYRTTRIIQRRTKQNQSADFLYLLNGPKRQNVFFYLLLWS